MSYCVSGKGTVVPSKKIPAKVVQDLLHAEFLVEDSPDGGLWLSFEYTNFNDQIEDALKAMAPYVKDGSVEFVGEDHEFFRYEFDDGKIWYADGKIVYERRLEL